MNAVDLSAYDQSWYDRGRHPLIIAVWDLVQTFLIHPSPHGCFGWRRFWYRLFGAQIGRHVRLRKSVRCNYPWKLSVGDHSWIGDEATLYCLERIEIGANAVVSQQAYLCTGSHHDDDPAFGLRVAPIEVHDGAWIALGALVMPGVTVGAGALIAARSVLTRDALPWTRYVGAPARAVGERRLDEARGSEQGGAEGFVDAATAPAMPSAGANAGIPRSTPHPPSASPTGMPAPARRDPRVDRPSSRNEAR